MRCALLALVAACGGAQPAHKDPVKDLTKFLPAQLEIDHPKQGEARSVHVRVWADAAVRAQPRWKEDIADELDYASQLLVPMLGVKLVVDEEKDWDRTGDPHQALDQLQKLDDGKDVTWVIGLIAPNDVASKAMAELGDAHPLGHHVIVRAWAEKPESELLAVQTYGLPAADKNEVLAAHKRHKQAVVILHVLAQTLGAIAEADPTWIQHPAYSPKQFTFAERTRDLLQLAIDARIAGGTDQQLAHDLLESILKQEWGGWIPTDHDQVVAMLRAVVDSGKASQTAADVPAAAYEELDRIRELRKRGQVEVALRELDNLLVAYPANATLHELKCELMIDKPGVKDDKTRQACARTVELAPGDPAVHLAVGEALAKAGDLAGARAELAQAQGKIANLKVGQDDAYRKLVAIYTAMGALTWTEEAIAAGKLEKDPVAAEVAQKRARYGVRRGTKVVKPDGEAQLVAAVRAALDLVYASKYGEAETAIAKGEKKWPGAPGFEATRCDLELRLGRTENARAACDRALAADPDESWALYLSAIIALKDTSPGATKSGITKLQKAIAVDPDLAQAWHALGKALARAKDQAALDALAKDYATKFGRALPP